MQSTSTHKACSYILPPSCTQADLLMCVAEQLARHPLLRALTTKQGGSATPPSAGPAQADACPASRPAPTASPAGNSPPTASPHRPPSAGSSLSVLLTVPLLSVFCLATLPEDAARTAMFPRSSRCVTEHCMRPDPGWTRCWLVIGLPSVQHICLMVRELG